MGMPEGDFAGSEDSYCRNFRHPEFHNFLDCGSHLEVLVGQLGEGGLVQVVHLIHVAFLKVININYSSHFQYTLLHFD